MWELFSNFLAFSEYLNFTNLNVFPLCWKIVAPFFIKDFVYFFVSGLFLKAGKNCYVQLCFMLSEKSSIFSRNAWLRKLGSNSVRSVLDVNGTVRIIVWLVHVLPPGRMPLSTIALLIGSRESPDCVHFLLWLVRRLLRLMFLLGDY